MIQFYTKPLNLHIERIFIIIYRFAWNLMGCGSESEVFNPANVHTLTIIHENKEVIHRHASAEVMSHHQYQKLMCSRQPSYVLVRCH